MNPRIWFPESSDDDWSAHADHLDDEGFLVGSIGGLLVEHQGRTLLIDAGYGAHQVSAEQSHPALGRLIGGDLLNGFRRIGRSLADVDVLALTHFHDDHVGWALPRPGQAPAFREATVVASAVEWTAPSPLRASRDPSQRLVRAGDGEEIFPGVTVWRTPGHTAGHTAYVLSSAGRRLIAFGDTMHTPVQIGHPQWRSVFDADHAAAVRSRQALIAALAEPDTVGFGVHFADVVFGRVITGAQGPSWEPVDDPGW
ncbi:MBL fold metallo-hydrolase [Actinoplanes sp. NPDC051851]|uniref:MBL fold metallo-hydrolase n=1 Tax=Actinoplanes sp. NPDC051851 TaxID=3154753 RepID=UPI00342DD018